MTCAQTEEQMHAEHMAAMSVQQTHPTETASASSLTGFGPGQRLVSPNPLEINSSDADPLLQGTSYRTGVFGNGSNTLRSTVYVLLVIVMTVARLATYRHFRQPYYPVPPTSASEQHAPLISGPSAIDPNLQAGLYQTVHDFTQASVEYPNYVIKDVIITRTNTTGGEVATGTPDYTGSLEIYDPHKSVFSAVRLTFMHIKGAPASSWRVN
jgi:hypothetical protein